MAGVCLLSHLSWGVPCISPVQPVAQSILVSNCLKKPSVPDRLCCHRLPDYMIKQLLD